MTGIKDSSLLLLISFLYDCGDMVENDVEDDVVVDAVEIGDDGTCCIDVADDDNDDD